MYRWLKSYFFISNQTTANDEYYDYDAWSLSGNQEKKYLETGLMLNAASSKCTESLAATTAAAVNIKYSKKNRTKANKTSHGISKSNSNTSISTNNSGCCCCCCCLNKKQNQSHSVLNYNNNNNNNFNSSSSYDHNEPLNDVYMNLTKFLNKQFCRNIKLRRPVSVNSRTKTKNHLAKSISQNTNMTLTNSNNNLSTIYCHSNEKNSVQNHSNASSLRSSVSPQPESQPLPPKRFTTNQSIDKFLNLKYETGPSSVSSPSLLSTAINYSKFKPDINVMNNLNKLNENKTTNIAATSKPSHSHFSSLSSYFGEVNNNNNSCGNNSDDLSFEMFASSSHRSSLFEFDNDNSGQQGEEN